VSFSNIAEALIEPNTDLKLFGKPEVKGRRRMGVALARADDTDEAVKLAKKVCAVVQTNL
jgi:phosphoribosylglycinamide formyltransferase 2